jgi:hypothetical protein
MIEHSILVNATAEAVWQHITAVDITSFRHPPYFAILGIPKPLRAEVVAPGVGGTRTAFFTHQHTFVQTITAWQPYEWYAFTFHASPGFRVVYCLDLADGPFRMQAGAYHIASNPEGVRLALASQYVLYGRAGVCLPVPVRLVLALFQRYLLRGIKANAERQARPLPKRNGASHA